MKHYLKETVFEIAEDAAKESKIKPSLETTEPGIVDDAKYTYYILDGSKEVSSNKVFELDPETGTFSVVAGLDYDLFPDQPLLLHFIDIANQSVERLLVRTYSYKYHRITSGTSPVTSGILPRKYPGCRI